MAQSKLIACDVSAQAPPTTFHPMRQVLVLMCFNTLVSLYAPLGPFSFAFLECQSGERTTSWEICLFWYLDTLKDSSVTGYVSWPV